MPLISFIANYQVIIKKNLNTIIFFNTTVAD